MKLLKRCLIYISIFLLAMFLTNSYREYKQMQEFEAAWEEILKQEEKYKKQQKNCLKNALYYEARSEGKIGIIAVASVIENRKNSGKYPGEYCKVINQRKQFSYTLEGRPDVEAIERHLRAADKVAYVQVSQVADEMLEGRFEPVLPSGVMHYATKKISNAWVKTKKIHATIGNHHFYKERH